MCGGISMCVCVCMCVSLCLWAVPVFLHCDLTGPQLSPGSMSPTGYPRSLLSWPESQTDRDDEGARDYSCVYDWVRVCAITEVKHCIYDKQAVMMCTVCTLHLQKVGVCIWSWGTLCYTSRSGTGRSAGLWPSYCSLQMDRPGTDNSPYECTPLSPRSWNNPPEMRE